MTPQVQLIDVSVRLPDSEHPVLNSVSIEIDEGEFVLVSGPTGAGKSTLLGVLSGLVPRFSGGELSGRLVIDGVDLTKAPPRERAGIIGYVGQDPAAGFVADTVEEELAYGMEQLGLDPATMRRRVEETLDLLGISELRDRDLRSLSGGQQQRVAIGAVLTMHPKVLVLDEPTSALDPTAAEDVLATLARLVSDLATTVVIAEHRLERVLPFADRVIVVTGDGHAQISETAAAMATAPLVPPLIELGRRLNLDPLPLTVREARRRIRRDHPDLFPSLTTTPAAPDHGRPGKRARRTGPDTETTGATEPAQEVALNVRRLAVERGGVAVLTGVDLELARGSVTALMGRNGAGKSTLLWALQGTQSRSKGHVEVVTVGGTTDPATLKAAARRDHVALLPQTASDLLYLETVADECAAAGPTTRRLLDEMAPGIPDGRHPRDLSEGQKLVLALAIILASTPPVVLLDEPTRGLDYRAKAALTQILKRLAADGHAILVATHDVEFVAQVADRTAVLAQGEIVSTGLTAQVVAQTPSFAPQVMKVLGPSWLNLEELSR